MLIENDFTIHITEVLLTSDVNCKKARKTPFRCQNVDYFSRQWESIHWTECRI